MISLLFFVDCYDAGKEATSHLEDQEIAHNEKVLFIF